MEISRNKLHEKALIIIYQCLTFDSLNHQYDIKEVISSNMEQDFDQVDIYLRHAVVSALAHKQEAIDAYTPNLKKWRFERLSLLLRSLLILSYAQYYHITNSDMDKKVIINVAVNLAKTYLEKDDYKFVNAILENTLK
jgi:N utilization substance protein B